MMSFYSTAGAVNENNLATETFSNWDKALQLEDGSLGLSRFAQLRTSLLEQGFMILESFAAPYQHHEWCGTP